MEPIDHSLAKVQGNFFQYPTLLHVEQVLDSTINEHNGEIEPPEHEEEFDVVGIDRRIDDAPL
jgi:hypothetical protein